MTQLMVQHGILKSYINISTFSAGSVLSQRCKTEPALFALYKLTIMLIDGII